MNDNRVSISTELDNSDIAKGAQEIKGDLGGIVGVVNDVKDALKSAFSSDFDKSIANANARVNELRRQLDTVSVALNDAIAGGDDAAAEKYGNQKIRIYDQLETAREKLANAVRAAAQKEAEAEEKAAAAKAKAAQKQFSDLTEPARRFGSRLREILSGALVFNLLSAGLREMTSYFGSALKSNKEFTKSFAQLKGALLTAFQPIYEVVLPALLSLMRVLTAVVQVIGNFFTAISGKSSSQMAENAEALYNEAEALDGVGGAAKKAQKQLAGFDEINKLSSTDNASGGGGSGSGSATPVFKTLEITDNLEHILYLIGAVGAALLTWKIASMFTSSLALIAGLALAIGGAVFYAFHWFDAFQSGIDWENLSGILLGMVAIVGGLALAFGTVGAAIGLLIAGIGLAVVSLYEWITTGELTNESLAALEVGILAVGAAISLLTGNWIVALVAAIVGLVVLIGTRGDEIKKVLEKLDNWLKGVFEKDWTETFGVLGYSINSFMYAVGKVWSGIKQTFDGVIDFIGGIFAGDWDRALNGLVEIFAGVFSVIKDIALFPFNQLGAAIHEIAQKVLPESWKKGINSVIAVVNKFVEWLNNTLSFRIDPIKIAGKTIFEGGNVKLLNLPQIPYLAQGAVLPANQPFLAMVGDQRHGTNIEAPLSTIQEAVALVMQDQTAAIMAGFETSVEVQREILQAVLGIQIGDEVIYSAYDRYRTKMAVRKGG